MEFNNETEELNEEILKRIRRQLYILEKLNSQRAVPKKDSEMVKQFTNEIKRIVQGG